MKPVLFLKQTLLAVTKATISRESLREILGASLYRNSIYLMLNSAILALTGLFFWVIAARLYPVEGVGYASAAISAIGLLALFATLGLDYGLIRFLPNSGEKASGLINSCLTVGSLIAVILSLIFLAGLTIWSPALLFIRQNPVFFAAFLIFTIVAVLKIFIDRTYIAKLRAGFVLGQGLIFGLLRFIPLVALAAFFYRFGIFASWGMALGISVAVSIVLFLPRIQSGYRPLPTIDREIINEMMHFSLANYAVTLFWAAPSLALPIMVVNLLGAESNAYFYIGWATASVLFAIPVGTTLSLFAEGSHNEKKLARNVRRTLKLIFVLLIPAVVLIFIAGDKILLLFGRTYSENATRLLWVLAISVFPFAINNIYFTVKRVEMRMKSVVTLTCLIAVATLMLSYVLLPRMGILGAGVAWLVSQTVTAVIIAHRIRAKLNTAPNVMH